MQTYGVSSLRSFLTKDQYLRYKEKIYHVNLYKFKCELLSTAIFNKSALPFISNLFIFDPKRVENESEAHFLQYRTLKYRFRICKFPEALIQRKFSLAVNMTYLSS